MPHEFFTCTVFMKKAREKIQAHPNRWQVVVYVEDDARVRKENWAELILDSLNSSAKKHCMVGILEAAAYSDCGNS